MWTREQLKENAKQVLSRTYWIGFVVCLIYMVLSGGYAGGNVTLKNSNNVKDIVISPQTLPILFFSMAIALFIFGIAIVYSIFVAGPLSVGLNYYFIKSREDEAKISYLFYGFTCGNYINIVKGMFLRNLYLFLWSLLFIIPGIIKSYEYYFVSYLLAENPNMEIKEAFEISKKMTSGSKWNIFVLQLSFLGWILLVFLLVFILMFIPFLGILGGFLVLFLIPYMQATFAELYIATKAYKLIQ